MGGGGGRRRDDFWQRDRQRSRSGDSRSARGHVHDRRPGISAWNLLFYGALVICGTLGISLYLRAQIKRLPAHESMLNIAEIIFQDLQDLPDSAGQVPGDAVCVDCRGDDVSTSCNCKDETAQDAALGVAVFDRRHGRFVLGRLVRHPRQHLCQCPHGLCFACAASRGTW